MPVLRVAIPAMDELEYLPATLDALSRQETTFPVEVYVCVNQPDIYWDVPSKESICQHNQQLLAYLRNYAFLTLHVLDYASRGCGWQGKKHGVGFARKVLFERIMEEADPDDIIVSLDADTYLKPRYLQSIAENFVARPGMTAVAVPYYHEVNPSDEVQTRAMLRYEIYMRNYAVNLLKINSPYGFTALGSAIAMRVEALRKIGNITPLQSGEDFYLVQKFCKMGGLSLFNTECVYPAGRYSDRVPFGTGPAMKQGANGVWDSYPIYHHRIFEPVQEAYHRLRELYEDRISLTDNDFLLFLQKDTGKQDIWADIRRNVSDFNHFVKAFHQKADGLRILQYARAKYKQHPVKEEITINDNLRLWIPEKIPSWFTSSRPLAEYSVEQLNALRNLLFEVEQTLRLSYH
ncbi:MAG: glycosyltransferase family 2 protein [Bacteroidales bacterium]|nr:glycosyltransferase family 2 protein [Bacteroidales bacterium]